VSDLPLVTIGLPVYNGERVVERALDSILAQTYPNLEVLVSDNCSTDNTEEVCRSYANQDDRVRYSRTERNLGAAGNYTRLAQLAGGRYFKWISHDDWIASDFVTRCVAVAEQDPEIITVAPVVQIVDEHGAVLQSVRSYVGRGEWSADRLQQYRQMMHELAYCETHSDGYFMVAYEYGLHRVDLLRRTRLELPFISSDYVLAAELSLFGRLAFLDEPLSRFVVSTSPESTSANFSSWDPMAIQRMLDPSRATPWRVRVSTRQRHVEHLRAVLRSPLSPTQKPAALWAATLPMRGRLTSRTRRVIDRFRSSP
jgi:glycosyltransferase involved in cell wall biosynthesis